MLKTVILIGLVVSSIVFVERLPLDITPGDEFAKMHGLCLAIEMKN